MGRATRQETDHDDRPLRRCDRLGVELSPVPRIVALGRSHHLATVRIPRQAIIQRRRQGRYMVGRKLRNLSELVTTNTELNAIAAPATIGFSSPSAATGIAITL